MRSAVCGLLAGLLATQVAGAQLCDRRDSSGVRSDASRDLYCLTLIAVPGESAAVAGHADLSRVPGPFTLAVTADGRAIYEPVITVAGLPAPGSLGNFTVFVAWVTPPTMYPAIKLGVIANGTTTVHRFALDPFVILITAREWTQQFEWSVHSAIALKAGVSPETVKALAEGRRPAGLSDEETAIYDFCVELHHNKSVSDPTYAKVLAKFGDQGIIDLVGINGYYTLLSMVMNVSRTPPQKGAESTLVAFPH